MSATIVSELRKIRSTRLWWVLLGVMAVSVIAITGLLGFTIAFADQLGGEGEDPLAGQDPITTATMIYSLAVSLGYVFPMILGALAVTSEFRHRTIDTTLLNQPHRATVIGAKFLAVAPYGALYGIVALASGVAVGAAALALAGQPTALDEPSVWRAIGMGVLALGTWALVGVGFGSLVTNQAVVIVALLAWTQLVEPMLRLALGFVEPLKGVGAYLPGAAGDAMVGASFYTATGGGELLAPWAGFLVLLGYGAVAAVAGWLTTFRRDIS